MDERKERDNLSAGNSDFVPGIAPGQDDIWCSAEFPAGCIDDDE